MAINLSTNPIFLNRITPSDSDYPYGSSKNSTGLNDGTPFLKIRSDDLFGWMQALLKLAGIVPNANADTALLSQYVQSIVQLASGRAYTYDDTGTADEYILSVRPNQQPLAALFDGMQVVFVPANTNTGSSTVNVGNLGAKDIVTEIGENLTAGDLKAGRKAKLVYNGGLGKFEALNLRLKTYSRWRTSNGYGTGTKIHRLAEQVVQSNNQVVTVSDNASNGLSITANTRCELHINCSLTHKTSASEGFSLNSNQTSVDITQINPSDRLAMAYGGNPDNTVHCAYSGILELGDIVRPHGSGADDSDDLSIKEKSSLSILAIEI